MGGFHEKDERVGWFKFLTLRTIVELLLAEMMHLGLVKVKRCWFVINEVVIMEERCCLLRFWGSQCMSKLVLHRSKLWGPNKKVELMQVGRTVKEKAFSTSWCNASAGGT